MHGKRTWLWLLGLAWAASACFDARGCDVDFDHCENDADCPSGQVCDAGFAGKSCVVAADCETADDCLPGETCEQRMTTPPQHPFDEAVAGRKVCVCNSGSCLSSSSSSSSSIASTSSASGGGAGAGGAGGAAGGAGGGGVAGMAGMGGGN